MHQTCKNTVLLLPAEIYGHPFTAMTTMGGSHNSEVQQWNWLNLTSTVGGILISNLFSTLPVVDAHS